MTTPPLLDYYQVLEVQESATDRDIRRAYRRLAKKYHPDLHPKHQEWALRKFRTVAEAYEVLGDPVARHHYDARCLVQRKKNASQSVPRPWESERVRQCRVILDALLDGREGEAVEAYEALIAESKFPQPLACLETRDHLDCKFLLAEAYENRGEMERAIRLYEEVFEGEREKPRVRHYFEELRDRLRLLYGGLILRAGDAGSARVYYDKAAALDSAGRNRSYLDKRMAEALAAMGEDEEARRYLRRAFEANPNLKGAQKVCAQLRFSPGAAP